MIRPLPPPPRAGLAPPAFRDRGLGRLYLRREAFAKKCRLPDHQAETSRPGGGRSDLRSRYPSPHPIWLPGSRRNFSEGGVLAWTAHTSTTLRPFACSPWIPPERATFFMRIHLRTASRLPLQRQLESRVQRPRSNCTGSAHAAASSPRKPLDGLMATGGRHALLTTSTLPKLMWRGDEGEHNSDGLDVIQNG